MKSRVAIRSEPDIARAVVEAKRIAQALGFTEQSANQVATAVSLQSVITYSELSVPAS